MARMSVGGTGRAAAGAAHSRRWLRLADPPSVVELQLGQTQPPRGRRQDERCWTRYWLRTAIALAARPAGLDSRVAPQHHGTPFVQ